MHAALILAGGMGARMGTDIPKQFLTLGGKPMLTVTLEAFQFHSGIDAMALVCHPDWMEPVRELLTDRFDKLRVIVPGGATRRDSSRLGLEAMASWMGGDDIVLIHDAARPLVDARIISDNILAAERFGAVNTVIPPHDSILMSEDGETMSGELVREKLRIIQTPQSFRYGLIARAHREAHDDPPATDDCSLVSRLGHPVRLVRGDARNLKVTAPGDLALAEWLLARERDI